MSAPARNRQQTPPRAKIQRTTRRVHDTQLVDDYAWIRAANWQEALHDPNALPAEIRALIKAENAYADAVLARSESLRATICEELRARVDDDDSDPPAPDGPFSYYRRYRTDGEHELICRRPRAGGEEAILLDGDALAADKPFFDLNEGVHSPDHRRLAYSCDETGSELHKIVWRDLATMRDGADVVENTDGAIVWMANSSGFLYTRVDDNFRTAQVFRHKLGADPASDELLLDEPNPVWFVHLRKARNGAYAVVIVRDHDLSENWLIDLREEHGKPVLTAPRREGVRYDIEPRGERVFIRTNADGAFDYKIVSAPIDNLAPENWREEVAHVPGRMIAYATLFARHMVRLERENCQPRLVVRDDKGEDHAIAFDEEAYHLRLEDNLEFDTAVLRFSYSSMARPEEIYDYDMNARTRTLLKRQNVPSGHNADAYVVRRLFASASDGQSVPISLLCRKDREHRAGPLLLYGYGAYGASIPQFRRKPVQPRRSRLRLRHRPRARRLGKRRALVREGKLEHKPNSFSDYIACARHLCASA